MAAIPFHGGTSPRDNLIKFWTQYYHASNMKLVVLGRGTLDDLQAVVGDTFGNVQRDSGLTEDAAAASTVEHANGADVAAQTTVSFIFPLENSQYGVVAFSPSTNLGVIREVIPVKEQRTI